VAQAVAPAQPSAQSAAQQTAAQQTAQQQPTQQSSPQQAQQNGQQNAYEQEELEELPVRDRGTAYAAMRAGQPSQSMPHPAVAPQTSQAPQQQQAPQPVGMGGAPEQPAPGTERPALPQRRGQQSHLRPELRQSPVLTRPIPGHSPNLLADLQLGRVAGQQEIAQSAKNGDNASDTNGGNTGGNTGNDDQQDRADDRNTEGEKGTWPTI
jgi:hypothetical protein